MALSFFLNVAVGAGLGPTVVPLAAAHVFGPSAGLAPPLAFTVAGGYLAVVSALVLALGVLRRRGTATAAVS